MTCFHFSQFLWNVIFPKFLGNALNLFRKSQSCLSGSEINETGNWPLPGAIPTIWLNVGTMDIMHYSGIEYRKHFHFFFPLGVHLTFYQIWVCKEVKTRKRLPSDQSQQWPQEIFCVKLQNNLQISSFCTIYLSIRS